MALKIRKKALDDTIRTLESLNNPVDKRTAESAAKAAVAEMKRLISKGKSPISGVNFKKLSKKYADREKGGDTTPNLNLSGKFLQSLWGRSAKIGGAWVSRISYNTNLSKKKESGHREGVNGQPKRPTLPEEGEKFKRSVMKAYMDAIRKGVKRRRRK